jgi:hypothetical protein
MTTGRSAYDERVDLIHFLQEKLRVANYLYESAAPLFEEIHRKIGEHEPPYLFTGAPEDYCGDEFYTEWSDAENALNALGASCLAIVQQAAHAYLTAWVLEVGGKDLLDARLPGNGWFGKYRYILEKAQIDLQPCAADIATIEQGILARNDFMHNDDLLDEMTMQSEQHKRKYPKTIFADARCSPELTDWIPLRVTRESLRAAADAVGRLCEYVDTFRYRFSLEIVQPKPKTSA